MAATVVFTLFLSMLLETSRGSQCDEGWYYNSGSCYGYGKTPTSWFEAAAACQMLNATLLEIETVAENDFIKLMLKNKQVTRAWIGGTDMFNEGNWVWVTTRQHIYPYSDWYTGQPTDAGGPGEDCLSMFSTYQYQWDDINCGLLLNFLCETHVNQLLPQYSSRG